MMNLTIETINQIHNEIMMAVESGETSCKFTTFKTTGAERDEMAKTLRGWGYQVQECWDRGRTYFIVRW